MRKLVVFFLLITIFKNSFSQKIDREIPDYPDEALDYSVKYGIFNIGVAHIDFNVTQECPGAFIQAYAKSTGLVKLIKDIYFRYDCCMDTATGFPITDSRILIEGDYVDISTVHYDHLSRKDSTLIYSKKTGSVVGPKIIYDLLSGFYYYRSNFLSENLPLNHTVSIKTFFIDKIWDLKIKYCGKDTIKINSGSIECLKVQPATIIGHFFRTSDAMSIWFANNKKYTPVKFSIDFKLGTLTGTIKDFKQTSINSKLKQ